MSLRCPLATTVVELAALEDSLDDVNLVHSVDKTSHDNRTGLLLSTPLSSNLILLPFPLTMTRLMDLLAGLYFQMIEWL